MKKNNKIYRFTHDTVFRSKITLTFTLIWTLLLSVYYFFAGYFNVLQAEKFYWSWYFSLSIWFLVISIFRLILEFHIPKLENNKKYDFKLVTIIFLFINLIETLLITITPRFFVYAFGSKVLKGITISSLVVSTINIVLFVLSFIPIKQKNMTWNEAEFLRSKNIISRMSGLFNILIVVINILILVEIPNDYISWTYLAIGIVFSIMSLAVAIKLIQKRKRDLARKK